MQTEYAFTLPRGFVDPYGTGHREGTMRLSTALDEIAPLQDGRVKNNEAYLAVVLLSRVVTRLGGYAPVPASVIEQLFATDFNYLQSLYVRINEAEGENVVETACPNCGSHFMLDLNYGDGQP